MKDITRKPFSYHLHREKTRHGKLTWVFRIGHGPRTRLRSEYGSPEFIAEYQAALEGVKLAPKGKAAKGTLPWLIDRYKESSAWARLSGATRRQREFIFLGLIENAGPVPFAAVTSKHIREGRERRAATPFAADNFLKAVRGLFDWAKEAEYIENNPAVGVNFLSPKTEGHAPWDITDMRKYEAHWQPGTRERVWFQVLKFTGFRLGDACAVGWQHVKDDWVKLRIEKTGVTIEIPLFPELKETLLTGPTSDLAWICNEYGRPFVKESFGNAFRRAAKAAGIVGKSAHGLRKSLATHGAESGLSEEELQAFFGWKSSRMSGLYTKSAKRKLMANSAAKKMSAEQGDNIFSRTQVQASRTTGKTSKKSGA